MVPLPMNLAKSARIRTCCSGQMVLPLLGGEGGVRWSFLPASAAICPLIQRHCSRQRLARQMKAAPHPPFKRRLPAGAGDGHLYSSSMADKSAHVLPHANALGINGSGSRFGGRPRRLPPSGKNKSGWYARHVVLLLLVCPHVGAKINGARRWINIGPSGFASSRRKRQAGSNRRRGLVCDRSQGIWEPSGAACFFPGLLIGVILCLIFIEPDRGTTILLALVAGGCSSSLERTGNSLSMLLAAWWRGRFRCTAIRCAKGGLMPGCILNCTGWTRATRPTRAFSAWVPVGDRIGLGNSRQKHGFLSEKTTDFILPIIGEEPTGGDNVVVVAFVLVVSAVCTYPPGPLIRWRGAGVRILSYRSPGDHQHAVVTDTCPTRHAAPVSSAKADPICSSC